MQLSSNNGIKAIFSTDRKPKVFEFSFSVLRPVTVDITLADPMRPNTAYTCREEVFEAPDMNNVWRIKLPITSEYIVFSVKINSSEAIDRYIRPKGLKVMDYLVRTPNFNARTMSFFKFITWFCEREGYLPTGVTYSSKDSFNFEMEYLDYIPGPGGGEHATPARIHTQHKYIQNSARLMRPKPIGRRLGINWHEYSHEFKNIDPDSEKEADMNGAFFFDQTGWNDWDYEGAFTKTFEHARQGVDMRNPATRQNYLVQQEREQAIINRYKRKNFLSKR